MNASKYISETSTFVKVTMLKIQATLLSGSSRSPTRVCNSLTISRMCLLNEALLLAIFEDISLSNVSSIPCVFQISITKPFHKWLALTPPALVKAHLGFDMETIASLPKTKPIVVGPV